MTPWIPNVGLALLTLGLGPLPAAPSAPQQQEGKADREAFELGLREAWAAHVASLTEHAAWCQTQQLFAARNAVLRAILELEPDHAEARRELGYRRAKDGSWTEPRSARAPKDHDPAALPEETRRRAELGTKLCARIVALADAQGAELDPKLRREAFERALALVPDDTLLRARLGETFDRDKWVLLETARGRRTRAALRPLVRQLLAEAEAAPRPVEPSARERAFGQTLIGAWQSAEMRVVAATDEAEALRVLAALSAARPLVNTLLGMEGRYHAQATTFLLRSPAEGQAWLAQHPSLDEAQRKYLAQLEGSGIGTTGDFAYWADDVRRRVDGSVRLGIAWLLADGRRLGLEHGLLTEGLGLYLTRELVGTRLTWFVQASKYERAEEDQRLRGMLMDPAINWMDEAHKLFQQPTCPKLQFLVAKPVNQMSTEDLLVSYVAVAYLLEGWPEEFPALVKAISEGALPQVAFEQTLGHPLSELDARMHRWLGERR